MQRKHSSVSHARAHLVANAMLTTLALTGCSHTDKAPSAATEAANLSVQSANAAVQGLAHPAGTTPATPTPSNINHK